MADHDEVGVLKPDHSVAAGVGCANRNQTDGFTVDPKLYGIAHAVVITGKPGGIAGGGLSGIGRRTIELLAGKQQAPMLKKLALPAVWSG